MSCTIKSIEQRLRNSNPELADQLTEKALGAWNTIKESKLFERVGNSFMANMPGTKKRNAQDRLIDELNGQSTATIKSGVEELFNENPELANQVYEALGFEQYSEIELKPYATDVWGKVPKQRGDNNFVNKEQYSIKINTENKGIDVRLTIYFDDSNKTAFVSNIENFENDVTHPLKKGLGLKAFLEANRLITKRGYTPVIDNLVSGYGYDMMLKLEKQGYLSKVLNKNISNSQYDNIKYENPPFIFTNKIFENQITPQQKQQALQVYSQYLDTIFPDSKVKDIVYHGTREFSPSGVRKPEFEVFDKSYIGYGQGTRDGLKGFYFGTKNIAEKVGNRIKIAILDIQDINDNTVRKNTEDFGERGDVFVVFEPEQIHILGSKQDIEEFKNSIKSSTNFVSITPENKVSVNALLLHTNLSTNGKIENVDFQSTEQYRNILSAGMLVEEEYKRIFTNKKGDIYTVQPTPISRSLVLSALEQGAAGSTMQDIWARVVRGTQSESDEMGFVALLADRLFNRKDEFTSKLFNSKPGGTLGRIYITNDNTFFSADNSGIYVNPKVVFSQMGNYQTFEDYKNALELILTEEVIHYTANNLAPISWFHDVYSQMSETKRKKIKEIYEFKQTGKDLEYAIANEYIRMALQLEHFNAITEQETKFIIKKLTEKVLNYIKKLFSNEKTAEVIINRFNTFLKEGNVKPYTDEQLYKDMQTSLINKGAGLLEKTKRLYSSPISNFQSNINETLGTPEIKIQVDGKTVGKLNTYLSQDNPNVLITTGIEVDPQYRKQGLAKQAYIELAKINPTKTLQSSSQITDDSKGVWESLVKDGIATKIGNNKYEIKNIEDSYTIAPIENESIPNQPKLAHNIEQMLDDLATRFQVNWGYDYEMAQRGAIRDGKVLINPNHATFDTPFHEYLHPFINLIKQQGSPFYQLLSNSVMAVTDITGKNVLFETKKNNPELVGDELIEEAIVEAAGLAAIGRLVETSVNKSFLDYLKMFLDNIGKLLGFDFEQNINLNTPFRSVVNMMLDSNFVYDMRPYANNANQNLSADEIHNVLKGLGEDLVTESTFTNNEEGQLEEHRKYKNNRTGDIYNGVHEDVIKPYYDKIFPNKLEETPAITFQKDAGTALHEVFQNTLYEVFVDPTTNTLRPIVLDYYTNPTKETLQKYQEFFQPILAKQRATVYAESTPDLGVIEPANSQYYYEQAHGYLHHIIKRAIKTHGPSVKFYAEQRLLNTEKGRAGTADLLIIGPRTFDIYDWKTVAPQKYNRFNDTKSEMEMLPIFKETAYKLQMKEYATMVHQLTGLRLGTARAIPIGVETYKTISGYYQMADITFGDPTLKTITTSAATGEEQRYLLPVTLEGETPDNKLINDFIGKLEGYIKVYSNMLQSDKDHKKIARELQIDALRKIIQDLQISRNHKNILNRIDVLNKLAEEQIILSDDTINIEKLTDIKYELDLYKDMQKYFDIEGKPGISYDMAQKQQLVIYMIDRIIDRTNNYTQNAALREGVPNILENEMAYSGAKRWFTELSAITQVKTVAFFDRIKRKAQGIANKGKLMYYEKLGKGIDGLTAEDIKTFFHTVNGKMQPRLISKYNLKEKLEKINNEEGLNHENFIFKQDVYDQGLADYSAMLRDSLHFKERITNIGNMTEKEFKDANLQIDAYNDMKEQYFERKLGEWEEKNSFPVIISGEKAVGVNWKYYDIHPDYEEEWFTSEYKEMASKPQRLELYNTIMEINEKAFKLGLISYRQKFTFFPSILANSQEKLLAGETGVFSMSRFMESFKASDQDEETITNGNVEINPLTKQIDRKIPKLYQRSLGTEKEDGTYEYSKQSFNIAKVYGQYVNHMMEYESRSELEVQAGLLLDLEKRKSNVLSVKGNAVYNEDSEGNLIKEITEGVNKNTDILEKAINRTVYGVTPFSDIKSTVKILGKEVNLVRTLRKIMTWRSMTTLGLNSTSAIVTGIGGNLNMFLEAGRNGVYNAKDASTAMATLSQTLFREPKAMRVLKMLQAIDPIIDDLNNHRINNLSLTKFDKIVTSDNLMIMLREVDKSTQFVSGMAVMNNYMVKDGTLYKISDYVKTEMDYDTKFKQFAENREWDKLNQFEKELEKRVEELKKTDSVVSKELKGEESGITEEMQIKLRPILQKYSKQILGNASRDDVAQYKDTILGQVAGQFKSWMPRLVLQRWGGAEIDNVSGQLNWGKYMTAVSLLSRDLSKTIQGFIGAYGNLNDVTYDAIVKKYNELLQKHIDNGGTKGDFITLSEFKNVYVANIRSTLKEILIMVAMTTMVYSLMAAWDDDDKLNAAQRYTLLLLNRANSELTFFINPKSATDLVKSPVPLVSVLTDVQAFASNLSKESFNQAQEVFTGDESKDLKKAQPTKYFLKLFPITKEFLNWSALLDDDFRKDFNINLGAR